MHSRRSAREWFVAGSEIGVAGPLPIDFQMHRRWIDGRSSLAEMLAAGKVRGLQPSAFDTAANPECAPEVDISRRLIASRERSR